MILNYDDIEFRCSILVRQMSRDKWIPDYVVGILNDGLLPATLISSWFNCKLHTLDVGDSNLWMAEDAFGYVPTEERGQSGTQVDPANRKNILIVNAVNHSGDTLNWIKQDWQRSCLPDHSAWDMVWDNNVRVAALLNYRSSSSEIPVRYEGDMITMDNQPVSVKFPWDLWRE